MRIHDIYFTLLLAPAPQAVDVDDVTVVVVVAPSRRLDEISAQILRGALPGRDSSGCYNR